MLLAGSLFMLAGAATVAVDLGSVYLARRQLQGVADAAALAGAQSGAEAAAQLVAQSGVANVRMVSLDKGSYTADAAIAVAERFRPDPFASSAAKVTVTRRVPLFFGRLLVGRDGVDLTARATAARNDLAAFSLGTGLASLNGGLPNMLLSNLAGTELSLSVLDSNGLLAANLDLLHVADALRVRLGRDGEAYGALFDREIPLSDVLGAMADASGGSPAATALLALAGRMPGRTVRLSDIVDLGPARSATGAAGQPSILLDAFSMLRMMLSPPSGTSVPMDLTVNVPGLSSTRLMVIRGEGQARSPALTITASRDVVLRTGQMRLYLDSSVSALLPGIASVRIPVYLELAAAEARLSQVDCGSPGGVTLAVTPSLGSAALGDIDTGALLNFSVAPNLRTATLAQAAGTRVTGSSQIMLGGTQAQNVTFSTADIEARRSKTVSTGDLTGGIAASLMQRAQLRVTLLGMTVDASPLASLIGGVLGTAAPLLDGIINNVTATLGIRLGTADVRVHQRRCGVATLVA
ncbi:hypothetical protein SAMIE_1007310 [Sphingobium amiense]|uniref:DUF2134 domain-containing protein n=1 Tax=Sphingobium amiense TaxID=135719 RepID=A0A494W9A4_9SPHN|nr:hypothetical protein SAMIE_1007310 [Sphingobium amiense]